MHRNGRIQRQVAGRWTFGLTPLSSLHTVTQRQCALRSSMEEMTYVHWPWARPTSCPVPLLCATTYFSRDLPLLRKSLRISVGQSSFQCAVHPRLPQPTRASCSAGDTHCESPPDIPPPPALMGLRSFRVVLVSIPAGYCNGKFSLFILKLLSSRLQRM